MEGPTNIRVWPDVGAFVERYESARALDDSADLADFVPSADHPDHAEILCELIRVDLEHQWEGSRRRELEHYRELFPAPFEVPDLLHAMAYEEYRLRLQAGEGPTPVDYRDRFGIDGRDWPSSPAAQDPGISESGADEMERAASVYRAYRREGMDRPGELDLLLESSHVPREHAELLRDLDRTDPHAAGRLSEAVGGMPKVGGHFLGFRLCGELGRGAFGRVYLARQGDLAHRFVALKVSADVAGETHALAQLQHTNVVPIYSVHRRGPLQAVCMPYLGSTTLADTLAVLKSHPTLPRSGEGLLSTLDRLKQVGSAQRDSGDVRSTDGRRFRGRKSVATVSDEDCPQAPDTSAAPFATPSPQVARLRGMGYVPAVLWLMARVADGLAHAHERGILHRDLKPANILFADDGEPLLLDFNLAADTKVRFRASAALVGGTLPYMAPEHLKAFRENAPTIDARSDVYALGIILYELLTGVHPFPVRRGAVDDVLSAMIADRIGSPPDVRSTNPSASPSVGAIVRRCLEPDPDRRYQTARELEEDLHRQLDDLPLKHAPEPSPRERMGKWVRRHPRLTSSTTVGLVSALLLLSMTGAFVARHRRYQQTEAAESFRRLGDERQEALALLADPNAGPDAVREGIEVCKIAAGRYHVLDDPSWLTRPLASSLPTVDRTRLREGLGELLIWWGRALALRSGSLGGASGPENLREAADRLARAEACYGPREVPRALLLARAELARRSGVGDNEVRRLLAEAETVPLRTPRERLMAFANRVEPGDRRRLSAFLDAVETNGLQGMDYVNWMILGNWSSKLGRFEDAARSYDVAVSLAPRRFWPRFNRGTLYLEMKEYSQAIEDLDAVIALRPAWAPAYLNRALAKLGQDDAQGAVDDLTQCLGMKRPPTKAWFLRARARRRLGDLEGARLDTEAGLKQQPEDEEGFVARGLARLPGDPPGALEDFEAALALNPRYIHALQDKASVLSSSFGRDVDAVKVLDNAIEYHPASAAALAGRGVLLARLGRREDALRDARAALLIDDQPLFLYQAACIFALTSKRNPADRPEAIRLLAEAVRKDGSWLDVAPQDRDLDPVRDGPEFRELIKAFAVVRSAGVKK